MSNNMTRDTLIERLTTLRDGWRKRTAMLAGDAQQFNNRRSAGAADELAECISELDALLAAEKEEFINNEENNWPGELDCGRKEDE